MNVCTDDMGQLDSFYGTVLGLQQLPTPPMVGQSEADTDGSAEWGGTASFFVAGHESELQIHATRRRPDASYEHKQYVNPLLNGHFCFRTDDIEAVLRRLEEHGVPYSDYGYWALKGWRQVFLSDPAGNIIEIHQVDGVEELEEFVPSGPLRLHHVNVCTDDMGQLDSFYGTVLGLQQLPTPPMVGQSEADTDGSAEWGGTASFFVAGHESELQIHATRRRPDASYEHKQYVNPLLNGHFCFRTDDIEAVLRRLEEHGVPYSDYGYWALKGWRQVFLSDPAGNIIEIHQVDQS
ncbi:VOC family protein [Kocuria sp. CPCC 205258]|uniref:VOC family protein n=1 Tax=Kocuria sp. CPCC 205258 TaxID=3073552 RepID=UPI0034D627AB